MLQSARTADTDEEEFDAAGAPGDTGRLAALRKGGAVEVVDSEHVALREIEDAEDAEVEVHGDSADDDTDGAPAESEEEQPPVATSLVEALDESERPIHRLDNLPQELEAGDAETNGTAAAEIGQDTAEDLAALFNAPTPWERDPTPPEPETQPAAPTRTYHTAEDLAALFNAPTSWERDPAMPETRSASARSIGAAPEGEWGSDEYEPEAFSDTSGDVSESTFGPAGTWDDAPSATYSAAEWPWVSRSGDGGFWAPPTDRRGTAAAARGSSGARPDTYAGQPGGERIYRTGEQPPTVGERTTEPPANAGPQAKQSTGERLRMGFRELGAWTAVAQVVLLAVGLVCIVQMFVLIVVSSYLSDARTTGGDVAIGSLAAHAKVDGVMLPVLLLFAFIAFIFAACRAVVTRRHDASVTQRRVHILGLPVVLWPVAFAAVMLLLVIIPETPPTVDAARRITQWALFACAVLGIACLAAPRGLEPPPAAVNEDVGRRRKRGASGGGVAPRAGSRSAA